MATTNWIKAILKKVRWDEALGIILAITIIAMIIMVARKGQTLDNVLLAGLIAVTTWYAYATIKIAKATREQAKASVKMAEEMREQRVMASRPVIIQKAQQKSVGTIITDYFSHFEIYNAGNGPAIEPEIFLLNENEDPVFLENEITYLRAGEALDLLPAEFGKVQRQPQIPVKVIPIHLAIREKGAYLVSQYQSIFSYGQQTMWYQTRLPFESQIVIVNGENAIRLIPGKLGFREVSEKERIVMPLVKGKPK
ncbi:MAG: hypothetical protein HYX81_01525 [Chloroflexi bacterium]|nr:hypothetical protein [Chloroflexota bacterium]MBI4268058.1 hypothetical protein [Chloroflexota bacterium]